MRLRPGRRRGRGPRHTRRTRRAQTCPRRRACRPERPTWTSSSPRLTVGDNDGGGTGEGSRNGQGSGGRPQLGIASAPASVVSWMRSEPSGEIVYRLDAPSDSTYIENTIRLPSGDQSGPYA